MKKILILLFTVILSINPAFGVPTSLEIDSNSSKITWKGNKITGSHEGTLKLGKGKVIFDGEKLTGGKFTINMNTINNTDMSGKDKKNIEDHLKSDDFFNVDSFPIGTFEINKATPKNIKDGSGTYQITGILDVKGIKKEVSFPASVSKEGESYTATAAFSINRTNWDIRYNSGKFFDPKRLGDKLIYDDIEIGLDLKTQG